MKKLFDVHTKLTLALLVFAVGSVGVSSIPYAMAMTPGIVSNDVTVGNTATLSVVSAKPLNTIAAVAVYTDVTTAIPAAGCVGGGTGGLPGPGAGLKYLMRNSAGAIAGFTITGTANMVNLQFGEANTFTPTGPGVGGLVSLPYHWDLEGVGDATTPESTTTVAPLPFTYVWGLCGTDQTPIVDPNPVPGGVGTTFQVVLPVAGELLPINTTALIIAGIQANALGFMVALTAIGAGAFGMLYLQVKRK